jgi:UDP-glucose 4-epimerase
VDGYPDLVLDDSDRDNGSWCRLIDAYYVGQLKGDLGVDLTGKRVIVTGGAGFVGSHIVDRLVAADNEVSIIDNFSTGRWDNIAQHRGNNRVQVHEADICDLEAMRTLIHGADVVFHLAVACVRASLNSPVESHTVNATGTVNVCQASLEAGVERFVYTSSTEVYGNARYIPMDEAHGFHPTNMYGASKLAGEYYTLAYHQVYGLPGSVIRLFNVYGPREPCEGVRAEVIPRLVVGTLAGMRPVIFGTGKQTRVFTWVEDTVNGIIQGAMCDDLVGDCVHLGGSQEVSIGEVCNLVLEKLGRQDLEPLYLENGRPGDVERHQADCSKACKMLGFTPTKDISAGLDAYIEWVQSELGQNCLDLHGWVKQHKAMNW